MLSKNDNDDVDVLEVVRTLWAGKLVIVSTVVIGVMLSIAYMFTAQEWWTSSALITKADSGENRQYQESVKAYQPVFDVYQDDGSIIISRQLDKYVNSKNFFADYVDTFNAAITKREFLESNEKFSNVLDDLSIERDGAYILSWLGNIESRPTGMNTKSEYVISFRSNTSQSAAEILSDYVDFVNKKVKVQIFNDIKTLLSVKTKELNNQHQILLHQAQKKVALMLERARYSEAVAKAAEQERPLANLQDTGLFNINLGTKAIAEKIKILESLKDFSIVEPRLINVTSKLSILESQSFNDSVSFSAYKLVEPILPPAFRTTPKKLSLLLMGAILGFIFGVFLVLMNRVYNLAKK
ncbi:Wzz/FepE/Etk N-terminal domain-containing protein [Photobacterium satsumensis]|uniref:Wzz/FepE/Etk N-terminal domain-containing protein n=1 Tax=Photobacterium satsumensis TaxID=2910239 RepID=UPI003D0BD116